MFVGKTTPIITLTFQKLKNTGGFKPIKMMYGHENNDFIKTSKNTKCTKIPE